MTTYVSSTMEHVGELLSKMPLVLSVLGQLDGKERWLLRPRPSIPVSLIRFVVYEGSITSFIPLSIVLGNFRQFSVFMNIVRKYEQAGLGRIAEAGRRLSREFTEQNGRIRRCVE